MKTLRESILSDIETTLSVTNDDVKNIINGDVPTINDFNMIKGTWYGVDWKCPLLIKKFAKAVEKVMQRFDNKYKAENIIGMRCMYHDTYLVPGHRIFGLYLYDKNERGFCIRGIGGTTEGISNMDAKRLILKFIEHVCNDHGILDKMVDIHNNAKDEWHEDTLHFKDFVKKL